MSEQKKETFYLCGDVRVRNVEAGLSGRLRPVQENWPISGRPVTAGSGSNGLIDHLTKILTGSYISQIAISETSCKQPPLLIDHLTKILTGSSISQIAISETSPKQPPLLIDHLTKILTGSSISQIAISETSPKQPPKPDIKGGCLREVPLSFHLIFSQPRIPRK